MKVVDFHCRILFSFEMCHKMEKFLEKSQSLRFHPKKINILIAVAVLNKCNRFCFSVFRDTVL